MANKDPTEEPEVIRIIQVWSDLTVGSENGKEGMGQTESMRGKKGAEMIKKEKKEQS